MRLTSVLHLDADRRVRKLLQQSLQAYGYTVTDVATEVEAIQHMVLRPSQLLILEVDLEAPLQGVRMCEQLREWYSAPIVFLTRRREKAAQIAAFDAGADDYIEKPFDAELLAARLRAVLRRSISSEVGATTVGVGGIQVDLIKHQVLLDGQHVHFTPREYDLLRLLMTHAGKVLTYADLLEGVWPKDKPASEHYVRVYVNTIRRKLGDDAQKPRYILTEPGIGYRFSEA
jgi:two-component system KDP operon response regulator KdpE